MADEKFEIPYDVWILPRKDIIKCNAYFKKCGLSAPDNSRDAMQKAAAAITAFQMDNSSDAEIELFSGRMFYWYAACAGHPEAVERYFVEIDSVLADVLRNKDEGKIEDKVLSVMIDAHAYWRKEKESFDPTNNLAHRIRLKEHTSINRLIGDDLGELTGLDFGDDTSDNATAEKPKKEVFQHPGVVVLQGIGDAESSDGRSLTKRFERAISKKLRLRGKLPSSEQMLELKREFPWCHNVIQSIDNAIDLKRDFNSKTAKLKPILLVGEAGTGKTSLAIRLAEVMNVKSTVIAIGGSADASGLAAVSRGWGTSKPNGVFLAMHSSRSADPCIILDEVEKGNGIGGHNGSVIGTLLSMLSTPQAFFDNCLLADVDISNVTWIATANSLEPLPEPLIDRFDVHTIPRPSSDHFGIVLSGMKRKLAFEHGTISEFLPSLDIDEENALRSFFSDNHGSLRQFERMFRFAISEAQKREKAMPRMALC